MNFPHRNNRTKTFPKGILFLLAFFALVALASLLFPGWTAGLSDAGSPLWSVRAGIGNFFAENAEVLRSKSDLSAENLTLRNELKAAGIQTELLSVLRSENDSLKAALGRKPAGMPEILVAILEKPDLSPYDTLVIDAGSAEGLAAGDTVLSEDGLAHIGFVSDVAEHTATVVLYSSPGEELKVSVGTSSIQAEAEGQGGGTFALRVPKEAGIGEGDAVVVPSISPNVFGVIGSVEETEADPYETALFRSPENVAEMKWVLVIPSAKP